MDKHLHIVCFDVPYPADYGGVIDVFQRIKALHQEGIQIHLHCFEYGRGKQLELNNYCSEVIYYNRFKGRKGFSFKLPYIVYSRANKDLLNNLQKDNHPILLEGIHCTYFLFTNQFKNRKVFVRLHNVEFEYYRQLAKSENSLFKKLYYKTETYLLKMYEKNITDKATLLAISKKDLEMYQNVFAATNIKYLPAFSPYTTVSCQEGKGKYCLYHGNLSIDENEKAAAWLCKNIFRNLSVPFIIAGKRPSKKFERILQQTKNISLIKNPSEEKMDELIHNAQINILPSFNSSGIKIKLLHALFTGRHCIVNNATVKGTGLNSLCHIAESEKDFTRRIEQLFETPFEKNEIEKRVDILKEFDNKANAQLLTQMIY